MKVTPEALKAILDRTLSEVAHRSILACRASQPFNLILAGQAARAKVNAAVDLVELDAVKPYAMDRFTVFSSEFRYDPRAKFYSVSLRGTSCQRAFCDLGVHCSCPDHIHRGFKCKHALAVDLWKLSGGAK